MYIYFIIFKVNSTRKIGTQTPLLEKSGCYCALPAEPNKAPPKALVSLSTVLILNDKANLYSLEKTGESRQTPLPLKVTTNKILVYCLLVSILKKGKLCIFPW